MKKTPSQLCSTVLVFCCCVRHCHKLSLWLKAPYIPFTVFLGQDPGTGQLGPLRMVSLGCSQSVRRQYSRLRHVPLPARAGCWLETAPYLCSTELAGQFAGWGLGAALSSQQPSGPHMTVRELIFWCLFCQDTNPMGSGLPLLMTPFNLNHLHKGPSST